MDDLQKEERELWKSVVIAVCRGVGDHPLVQSTAHDASRFASTIADNVVNAFAQKFGENHEDIN